MSERNLKVTRHDHLPSESCTPDCVKEFAPVSDKNYLDYNFDVHKDCSPCPNAKGETCDKIGTGIHEPIRSHLIGHGWSEDKVDGIVLGGLLSGTGQLEVLHLAHDGILLFSPRDDDSHTSRDASRDTRNA